MQNLIKPSESANLGSAINALIKDNIKGINTCFLAEVKAINGNKANIVNVTNLNNSKVIIPNCLVAQPLSSAWQIAFKIEVGDIGLALTMKNDISHYKNNGKSGKAITSRYFDLTDTIFLPLSLFLQKNNDEIEFLISDKEAKNKLEFKGSNFNLEAENNISFTSSADFSVSANNVNIENQGDLSLKSSGANPIEIGNSVGTLASVIDSLFQAMDLIASGLTGAGSNPAAYNAGKSALQAQIQQILK